MIFDNNAPEWDNPGSEPSENMRKKGFYAGYKPPAGIFNWFWNRVSRCIKELQEKLSVQDDNKVDKTQYASTTQAGVVKLYSVNGVNRSGLVTYNNGDTAVNVAADYGLSRSGDGKVVTAAASESDITAKTNAYKPVVPKTLDYAAGAAAPDITAASTLTDIASKDSISVIVGKTQKAISELKTLINMKGAASGLAELDVNGKVPSAQLPSYVDDVLEYETKAKFPSKGENGKIYVDTTANLTYRWSGSQYVEISPSLALGETEQTAYRGDRGKTAYDHSQAAHAPTTAATQSAMGLMSIADKKKLDGIAEGANKTVVDTALSEISTNPVRNSVITTELNNGLKKIFALDPNKYIMSCGTAEGWYRVAEREYYETQAGTYQTLASAYLFSIATTTYVNETASFVISQANSKLYSITQINSASLDASPRITKLRVLSKQGDKSYIDIYVKQGTYALRPLFGIINLFPTFSPDKYAFSLLSGAPQKIETIDEGYISAEFDISYDVQIKADSAEIGGVNMGNSCLYSETPQRIGTWIDGTPIWRIAFSDTDDSTRNNLNLDGDYSIEKVLRNAVTSEEYVYVLNAAVTAMAFDTPCVIDDCQLSPSSESAWYYYSARPKGQNFKGVYGYIEFAATESNIKL